MAITKLNRYSLPTTLDLSAKTLTLPSASVTAHVTQTDLQPLKSDLSALALREATNESSAAFNLPNQFIETFTDDTNLGTQTTGDRTSGYWYTTDGTPAPFGGNDANTKLLLHMDDTGLTDSSASGHTVTLAGGAARSGTQSKFGSYSAFFDGVDDYLNVASSSDFNHGTGDFTIEGWVWLASDTTSDGQFVNYGASTATAPGFGFQSQFDPYFYTGAHDANFAPVSHSTWTHIAVSRASGSLKSFKDGVLQDTNTYTGNIATSSPMIGAYNTVSPAQFTKGYFDEIRISNVARFTTAFTPPTVAYHSGLLSATGTLIQSANTVASAKTKVGGTMLYKDHAGTATLGTDLKIYFTADGGSNWTEAASYNAITPVYSTGIKQVRLGETTVTSGTDVRYKAVFANQASGSKETQLHGIGVNY